RVLARDVTCRFRGSPSSAMAGLEGFEPPTPGFGDRCSSRTELQAYFPRDRPPAALARRSGLRSVHQDTSRPSFLAVLHAADLAESVVRPTASPCVPCACDRTGNTSETRRDRDAIACSWS